jgi:hypothetical protein
MLCPWWRVHMNLYKFDINLEILRTVIPLKIPIYKSEKYEL